MCIKDMSINCSSGLHLSEGGGHAVQAGLSCHQPRIRVGQCHQPIVIAP